MELSINTIKTISSLSQKKHRDELGCFVAEGSKCVLDTIQYFRCKLLVASREWIDTHSAVLKRLGIEGTEANSKQLQRLSQFKTASEVVAVYEIPDYDISSVELQGQLTIALDGIQDPGNLGTIIRLADWFGIRQIICSNDTVDVYNHKVVQATMGAISRVKVYYCNLAEFIGNHREDVPVFVTSLQGNNIYNTKLPDSALIVMGNEGKGVTKEIQNLATDSLLIPSMCADGATSESLNVGVATAITLSEFCRDKLK